MSILEKFLSLNNFSDKENFYELICLNRHLGYIHEYIVELIIGSKINVTIKNKRIILVENNFDKLSSIFDNITDVLIKKRIVKSLTGERFPCKNFLDGEEYFNVDRASVEFFGIRGYGVHLTAYIKFQNKIYIWVPKRASSKKVEPNKYDNTIAGGISSGETLYNALAREAKEEANISKKIINRAIPTGTVSYNWRNKKYSLRRDTLYLFDLEVDKNFNPICTDGELVEFKLMPDYKVFKMIKNTNSFKKNCVLVIANFLIRKGVLNPKNDADYESICMKMNL